MFALRQAIGIGDVARLIGMRLGDDRVVLNAKGCDQLLRKLLRLVPTMLEASEKECVFLF